MSAIRSTLGAIVGASVATVVLRVRAEVRRSGSSVADVVVALPALLADDVERISDAARAAAMDGKREAARVEADLEKVITTPRQTR